MNKEKFLDSLSVILILTGILIIFLPQISTKVIQGRTEKNANK